MLEETYLKRITYKIKQGIYHKYRQNDSSERGTSEIQSAFLVLLKNPQYVLVLKQALLYKSTS